MKKLTSVDVVGTFVLITVFVTIVLCLTVFHNGTWIANFNF